jgi:hypothetical protein
MGGAIEHARTRRHAVPLPEPIGAAKGQERSAAEGAAVTQGDWFSLAATAQIDQAHAG